MTSPESRNDEGKREAPHVPAAFINAIADEGTKAEAVEWLQKTWNELCAAEAEIRNLRHDIEKAVANHSADLTFAQSETGDRNAVIEEVAKSVEDAPLTYFGPDPGGIRDLKFLIVAAIRDMKKGA